MVKVSGIPIVLNGDTYIVPPLALGALQQLRKRIEKFAGDASDLEQVDTVIEAAFCALKRNYPDLTKEQVGELIDLENMMQVFEAIMDVSGLKRKEIAKGEALAGN